MQGIFLISGIKFIFAVVSFYSANDPFIPYLQISYECIVQWGQGKIVGHKKDSSSVQVEHVYDILQDKKQSSTYLPVAADFLPPENEVWGKVIFSQASVIPSVHRGGSASGEGGLPPGNGGLPPAGSASRERSETEQ